MYKQLAQTQVQALLIELPGLCWRPYQCQSERWCVGQQMYSATRGQAQTLLDLPATRLKTAKMPKGRDCETYYLEKVIKLHTNHFIENCKNENNQHYK